MIELLLIGVAPSRPRDFFGEIEIHHGRAYNKVATKKVKVVGECS